MKARAQGFTLIETLVALTLLGCLIAVTLAAVDRQVSLFSQQSSQLEAMQNGRFALNTLEKDIPTTGTNTAADQPFLVYADTNVVVFNADYLSNIGSDVSAIYVDTSASAAYSTAARTPNGTFIIPLTNIVYPAANYTVGGQNSPAETITFFFAPDTITARIDDFVLWRQVNGNPADLIARGLLRHPNAPFFTYQRRVTPKSGNPYLQSIGAAQLPLRHWAPTHLSVADTGVLAVIDQLRAVQVTYRVTDARAGKQERVFNIMRTIALPNAGLGSKQTCGDLPMLGNVGFTATPGLDANGKTVVTLTWNQATDESSGEKDVVRYILYRQNGPGAVTDPYMSIPSGQANYMFVDSDITPGVPYYYAIAVQDCTPSLSGAFAIAPIIP